MMAPPPSDWETRIHPSPLHLFRLIEVTDSSHSILRNYNQLWVSFQVASWFHKQGKGKISKYTARSNYNPSSFKPYWISSTTSNWFLMGPLRFVNECNTDFMLFIQFSVLQSDKAGIAERDLRLGAPSCRAKAHLCPSPRLSKEHFASCTCAGSWHEEESNFFLKSGNQSKLAELDWDTWAICLWPSQCTFGGKIQD